MSGKWDNPTWRKYSKLMRRVHPWCVKCRDSKNLQVHHTWYSPAYWMRNFWPIWLIFPWTLMVLCQSCHAKVTGMHNGPHHSVSTATRRFLGEVKYKRWRLWSRVAWLALPAYCVVELLRR